MTSRATLPYIEVESSLGAVLNRLTGRDGLPLSIEYGDRVVQPGYHVTEVKAGSFVTLDCGGNPDAWQETVLQVEDIPATDGRPMMTAGKFRSILAQVDKKVRLDHDVRLTIEIGRPGEAMQVFDIADLSIREDRAVLSLGVRAAICKPRHRAEQASVDTSVSLGRQGCTFHNKIGRRSDDAPCGFEKQTACRGLTFRRTRGSVRRGTARIHRLAAST